MAEQIGRRVGSVKAGQTSIEVVEGDLLSLDIEAILLRANNGLETRKQRPQGPRKNWAYEIKDAAGAAYAEECRWLVEAAGPGGLLQGTAAVTGSGKLADGSRRRWILQAVTIGYLPHKSRVRASPQIIYGAVRAALERAEVYRIESVATYVMVSHEDYRTEPLPLLADALDSQGVQVGS